MVDVTWVDVTWVDVTWVDVTWVDVTWAPAARLFRELFYSEQRRLLSRSLHFSDTTPTSESTATNKQVVPQCEKRARDFVLEGDLRNLQARTVFLGPRFRPAA
jgi:hypothetical protein